MRETFLRVKLGYQTEETQHPAGVWCGCGGADCVGGPERRLGGWMGEGGGQELRASRAGLTSSNGDFISP